EVNPVLAKADGNSVLWPFGYRALADLAVVCVCSRTQACPADTCLCPLEDRRRLLAGSSDSAVKRGHTGFVSLHKFVACRRSRPGFGGKHAQVSAAASLSWISRVVRL